MEEKEDEARRYAEIEKHLKRRSECERVIVAVSARLARREGESIDELVTQSLGEIYPLTWANRIFLFLFEKASHVPLHLFEWKNGTISSQLPLIEELIKIDAPWFLNKLKENDTIEIQSLLGNDSTIAEIKIVLQKMDTKKILVFPIFVNYEIEGFLAFDLTTHVDEWSEEDLHFFRTILQVLGMALDRVIKEEKLRRSEEKYRSILENIKESYFEIDGSGVLTFFNYALCDLFGYTASEILGKPISFFLIESDRVNFRQFFTALKKNPPKLQIEMEVKKKDGKRVYVEGTFYPKPVHPGNGNMFYGFLRDITERKKSEELREKFTQKLEIEVKMRTKELNDTLAQQKLYLDQILKSSQFKSEFMATMSHELRTPLNAIIGFSEILLEKMYGDLNNEQMEYVGHIHSSADHLLEMINRILDISKIEAGRLKLNMELVKLDEIVKQVEVVMRPLYKKKSIDFESVGFDVERPLYADPIRLKEIVMNLFSNAIKYTKQGKIIIKCVDRGDDYEVSVIDNGVGIAEKDHARVFKEFERIENELSQTTQGTGLGLSLTRRLVHLHGGEISFTSTINQGSTFSFTIPKQYRGLKDIKT